MGQVISIKLFDHTYRFKADTEASDADSIASYVVKEIEKAKASADVPSKLDTVILAALNIANDYFVLKQGHEALRKDVNNRCRSLVNYIDENV